MRHIPKNTIGFLWYFMRQQKVAFVAMAFGCVIWGVYQSLFPYFIKILVDQAQIISSVKKGFFGVFSYPLKGMLAVWVMMEIGMRSYDVIYAYAIPKFRANIREKVFHEVSTYSLEYFLDNFGGNIVNKIADLPRSAERIVQIFIFCVIGMLSTFTVSTYILWKVNSLFSYILLGFFCGHMIITLSFKNIINEAFTANAHTQSILSGRISDNFTNILSVKLFSRHKYEFNFLQQIQKDEILKGQKAFYWNAVVNICRSLLTFSFMSLSMLLLVYGWQEGWVSLGDFSLIALTSFSLCGLTWWVNVEITNMFREAGVIKAALSLLAAESEFIERPEAKELQISRGQIQFDQVNFSYKGGQLFFKNKSLTIEPGQKVGLVGFSGGGKSTFVNLILRFFDIQQGRITIDGQDISKVTKTSLRESISMIPQDITLFHRSLMENIRYGREGATDEEVIEAAHRANAHEFIKALGEGYETQVGERGVKLSGGQRQRIAIARAFLKDAPIVILDEATSALDSVTERQIQISLQELMRGRTSIVIAHRLSTLQSMDRILVFDQGKIVEDGSSEQLLENKGYFYRMWNMQSSGYLPEEVRATHEDLTAYRRSYGTPKGTVKLTL